MSGAFPAAVRSRTATIGAGSTAVACASRTVAGDAVRAHIRDLMACETGVRRIAALAGITPQSVSRILYGVPSRNVAPATRIGLELACKILRVEPNPGLGRRVSSIGTTRRLQALVARGWTLTYLAGRLDYQIGHFSKLLRSGHVTAAVRTAVDRLYSELWDQDPPEDTPQQRTVALRARSMAARRRWAPPMAWDDDQIDDPAGEPFGASWGMAG